MHRIQIPIETPSVALLVGLNRFQRDMYVAREAAKQTWKKIKAFAPVALDPQIEEILNDEFKSIEKVFRKLMLCALQYKSDYIVVRNGKDEVTFYDKPGGRRWGQRVLAAVCKVAPSTVQIALKRLRELGLITTETSRKWGTFIAIVGFEKMCRARSQRAVVSLPEKQRSSGVPMAGAFSFHSRGCAPESKEITDLVDVPNLETGKKYKVDMLREDVRNLIRAIQRGKV